MSDFFTRHFHAGARIEAQAGIAGQVLEAQGLRQGAMISPTKECPDGHMCFFNACIFVKERAHWWSKATYRQVWWGDIDLTSSRSAVIAAADILGRDLWVTRERYRWDGYNGESDGAVYFAARRKR